MIRNVIRTARGRSIIAGIVVTGGLVVGLSRFAPGRLIAVSVPRNAPAVAKPIPMPKTIPEKIVAGAVVQIGDVYDASYVSLTYPGGDVPKGRGACTDVVIRSYRNAGMDLQKLIHEDIQAHFGLYPRKWGLHGPDPSIDHRRVPNLQVFLSRQGQVLPRAVTASTLPEWRPGDIVTWKLASGQDHTGILSDQKGTGGVPLVIHNMGRCSEMDCLTAWPITGHYRYPRNSSRL